MLTREGVEIHTGTAAERVVREGGTVTLTAGDVAVEADALLVATGRSPVTDGLEPERGGVTLDDRGFVAVDEHLPTGAEGVWAVSHRRDVIHELALAVRTGAFTGRLAQTVHAYPSWSLAVREAAVQFFSEYKGRRARPAMAAPPER